MAENWMKWDISSEQDIKTRWFLNQFQDRARGLGFFVHIVSQMYETNDGWLEVDDIFLETTAEYLGWTKEDVSQAIAKQIQAKLCIMENGKLTSKRTLREIEKRKLISEKRKNAGRKGGTSTTAYKQSQANAKQKEAKSTRLDKIRIDKSNLDKSKLDRKNTFDFEKNISENSQKKSKPPKQPPYTKFDPSDFEIPPKWGEKAQDALRAWIDYRVAHGSAKQQISYQTEITRFKDVPRKYVALVMRAIAEGWQGLNEKIPFENEQNIGSKPKNIQNIERSFETLVDFTEEL
jgi:hypothetical protein